MIIELTIDRLEGDKAVLITADGVSLVWPKDKLPDGIHEGSALNFEIMKNEEREKRDKQTAKDILNEIIN